jgi:hypothetical protein
MKDLDMSRKHNIGATDISTMTGYSLANVYVALAERTAPKPVAREKFGRRVYDLAAVKAFFAARIDHRHSEYRTKRRGRK